VQKKIWEFIKKEAEESAKIEPLLSSYLYEVILNHKNLQEALSYILSGKLNSSTLSPMLIREIFDEAFRDDPEILKAICCDIEAIQHRDPAAHGYSTPFLYYKGFHALESYRVTHWLWKKNRIPMALWFQNRISEVFSVDIHPAAKIGCGILMDHATSVVVGETAVIEDDVSILHEVTLGGTGKEEGDRHPKIRKGVLIGAGAKILGNIEVGERAKIGAGSVVLCNVLPHTTVAGVPAKIMGTPCCDQPSAEMDHGFDDE